MQTVLFVVLSFLLCTHVRAGYDWTFGNTSIWLCAAAYCETSTYKTRTFKGYTEGFKVTSVIDDKAQDVQVQRNIFQ